MQAVFKQWFSWFWLGETYREERCRKHQGVKPEAGGNKRQHTVSIVENADQHRALHQRNIKESIVWTTNCTIWSWETGGEGACSKNCIWYLRVHLWRIKQPLTQCITVSMKPSRSQVNHHMVVFDALQLNASAIQILISLICESKWLLLPNLKKLPQGIPVISHPEEWDRLKFCIYCGGITVWTGYFSGSIYTPIQYFTIVHNTVCTMSAS